MYLCHDQKQSGLGNGNAAQRRVSRSILTLKQNDTVALKVPQAGNSLQETHYVSTANVITIYDYMTTCLTDMTQI